MTQKRAFFGMVAVVILLCALFTGAVYGGSKLLKQEGNRLLELKLQAAVLDKESDALLQAKRDIAEYSELEAIAKSVVPQDKDQAQTVLELIANARDAGIVITGVQFPASELGSVSSGKKSTSSDPALTQLTPLDSPKGVYAMTISIDIDRESPISYVQLLDFLRRLENNRRTAQVTNISISPDESDRTNIGSLSLTLTSYVKP